MGNSSKTRPAGAWFILPSVLLLAALALGVFGIASFLKITRQDFVPYEPGSSISVTSDGFTLYGDDGAPGLSLLRCAVTGPAGETRLERVTAKTSITNEHGGYTAISSSPKNLPAGQYVITCEGRTSLSDARLYVGPRFDLGAVGRFAIFGIIAPLFLGFCAVVLFVVLFVLRYRSGRRIAAAAATPQGPPFGPPAGPPPGPPFGSPTGPPTSP